MEAWTNAEITSDSKGYVLVLNGPTSYFHFQLLRFAVIRNGKQPIVLHVYICIYYTPAHLQILHLAVDPDGTP